jgi:hypothetical protein
MQDGGEAGGHERVARGLPLVFGLLLSLLVLPW